MKALKWINAGAFAVMIIINALANLLPIGGRTTGQISEAYPNLFTPAPITFGIWAVIYLLLLIFVIYQFGVFDGGTHSTRVREDIGILFTCSCVLNIAWILFWHSDWIGFSTICIMLLLVTLIMIQNSLTDIGGSRTLRLAVKAGLSLYYGWIIAATIANLFAFTAKIGWNGWGIPPDIWTILALLIGTILAAAIAVIGENRIATFGIIWAYTGILIRHISPKYYAGTHPFIIAVGFLCKAFLLAVLLMPIIKGLSKKLPASRTAKQSANE